MSRFVSRKSILSVVVALTLVVAFAGGLVLRGGVTRAVHAASGKTTKSVFCSKLGKTIQASSGAQMYCFGAQASGPAIHSRPATKSFGPNVNAADPNEDISPSGVRAYGQTETSIAASGHYAVEAWNDATSFFSACGAPQNKEQGTGLVSPRTVVPATLIWVAYQMRIVTIPSMRAIPASSRGRVEERLTSISQVCLTRSPAPQTSART